MRSRTLGKNSGSRLLKIRLLLSASTITVVVAALLVGVASANSNGDNAYVTRAEQIRDQLGLPIGVSRHTQIVHDPDRGSDLHEVDELGIDGKVVSMTQLEPSADLALAMRFGAPSSTGPSVTQKQALGLARTAAMVLGLESTDPVIQCADPSMGGWFFEWHRSQQGVPVRGDGTMVRIWPDGHLASVSSTRHDLVGSTSPAVDSAAAEQDAQEFLSQIVPAIARGDFVVDSPTLQWVSPNSAFSEGTFSQASTMSLAWVVNATATGNTAEHLRMLALFISATDGSLIGGDQID